MWREDWRRDRGGRKRRIGGFWFLVFRGLKIRHGQGNGAKSTATNGCATRRGWRKSQRYMEEDREGEKTAMGRFIPRKARNEEEWRFPGWGKGWSWRPAVDVFRAPRLFRRWERRDRQQRVRHLPRGIRLRSRAPQEARDRPREKNCDTGERPGGGIVDGSGRGRKKKGEPGRRVLQCAA